MSTTVNIAVLVIDAIVNLTLGFLLLLSVPFPGRVAAFLGVPGITHAFYASLFVGVLVAWLVLGDLAIPVRGRVFLWGVAALLMGVSAVELIAYA